MNTRRSTIFTNGSVYFTGAGDRVTSLLVESGRIVATGTLQDLRDRAGRRSEEIDLAGGLISPTFTDAHAHPVMGGAEMLRCDLQHASSPAEAIAMIGEYARAHPRQSWITGGGWRLDLFAGGRPDRHMLDAVVPDRPVMLHSADRHIVWVNTCALREAGIDAATVDPIDGRFDREPDGMPSGLVHEGAFLLVNAVVPELTFAENSEALLTAQQHFLANGVGGWQDAMVRASAKGVDLIDVYLDAIQRDALVVKATGALWWERHRGLGQLSEMIRRRDRAATGAPRFRADTIKIALDGVIENFTAALTAPYLDSDGAATANTGLCRFEEEELAQIVEAADAEGFQLHFHAVGDRAVRLALDVMERSRDVGNRALHRHQVAHLQVVDAADVPRFATLDVIANLQPLWAQSEPQMTELTLPFLPEVLRDRQYVFGELFAARARLAGGSDWPVSSVNPLAGMQVAVTRQSEDPTNRSAPLLPAQSLTLRSIWDAYTAGSAYAGFRENETGTIAAGKSADLVLLDRNPFRLEPSEISECVVKSTWIDGVCRYDAG